MKYMYLLALLLIISVCFCRATPAKGVEIVLEAELANRIVAPMVIAVPADAKAQGGPEPDEPSRGKFIWAPDKPLQGGANGDRGYAEFIIDIPSSGKYAVWGRVIAWDGNSDSFWVTWKPSDPDENPQVTKNVQFRWGVAGGNTWHWDRINHWLDGGTFEREWKFEKGESVLAIWTREDAAMLDCIYITDEIAAGGNMAREPTDDEVKAQIMGGKAKSVDGNDKLSATWGRIKGNY